MLKRSAPEVTALFITVSLQIYAQVPRSGAFDRLTASGLSALADASIDLIATPTHDQANPLPAAFGLPVHTLVTQMMVACRRRKTGKQL
jgi:hypothetical protein